VLIQLHAKYFIVSADNWRAWQCGRLQFWR